MTFYDASANAPRIFFRAQTTGGRVTEAHPLGASDGQTLSPSQLALIAARQAATRTKVWGCARAPFNTVVLPSEAVGGPVDVYFLTPQVETSVYPLGGHFKASVAADGRILAQRAFSKSCIDLPTAPDEDGHRPAMLIVTHLMDSTPTEIHVFTSLSAGLPILVVTNHPERRWVVDGAHIRPFGEQQ